jgi:two-component system, OmpR family, sensor histidine kinase BaeS
MQRRFMRRIGCFVGAVVLVLALVIAGTAWLITSAFGGGWLAIVAVIPLTLLYALALRGIWHAIRGRVGPLGDLIDASQRIEAGEVGAQVPVRGPGELKSLGRAFNSMSSRLAADTDERRRLLADVSHELRTPLTVIQGNVEAMLDGVYPADRPHLERLLAETRHLELMIEDLRTLSLADAGALPLHREPTDLAVLAAEVIGGFEAQASAAGVALAVDTTDAPALDLDPHRFRQVIGNLVSNALRHTPNGGSVTVRIRPAGDRVELEVADTGSGMDAASAERAFDRFWRSGHAAGAGIGLAIVRDLVRAHGGDVSLQTEPGEGTTVRCSLPLTLGLA